MAETEDLVFVALSRATAQAMLDGSDTAPSDAEQEGWNQLRAALERDPAWLIEQLVEAGAIATLKKRFAGYLRIGLIPTVMEEVGPAVEAALAALVNPEEVDRG